MLIKIPAKEIRAQLIALWLHEVGAGPCPKVVCFSSGNAAKALREVGGLDVLEIGPKGDLEPRATGQRAIRGTAWWTQGEIRRHFPNHFDATSGHLPMECMVRLADRFGTRLGKLPAGVHDVPTGSGETIVCLGMAYGPSRFRAVYSNDDSHTRYNPHAPLAPLVHQMFERVGVPK